MSKLQKEACSPLVKAAAAGFFFLAGRARWALALGRDRRLTR
ncbi:hypothetical protein [Paenibacillus sp. BK720]|nr:hypothetical protein [Paenibacillus sp. BK720]NIK71891.1 hypothetical protein [Paenibacillus sp. BK720]